MGDRDTRKTIPFEEQVVKGISNIKKDVVDIKSDITTINSNINSIEDSIIDLELRAIAYSIAL